MNCITVADRSVFFWLEYVEDGSPIGLYIVILRYIESRTTLFEIGFPHLTLLRISWSSWSTSWPASWIVQGINAQKIWSWSHWAECNGSLTNSVLTHPSSLKIEWSFDSTYAHVHTHQQTREADHWWWWSQVVPFLYLSSDTTFLIEHPQIRDSLRGVLFQEILLASDLGY